MKFAVTFFLPMLLAHTLDAQSLVGMKTRLDSMLQLCGAGANQPGFSVCITKNGQIVYEYQTGMAVVREKTPITPGTVFNIGSVSKQFTAASIYLLEQEGKLKRSDPVHRYLPELPDFGKKITLDHLIAHTSGLYCHLDVLLLRYQYKDRFNTERFMFDFYQKYPVLSFDPGSDFAYNNSAYMMLAIVVERVSGVSFGQFVEQRLFLPNGMNRAVFCQDEVEGVSGATASYRYNAAKKRFKKSKPYPNILGATGVHCTLRDLAKWQFNFTRCLGAGQGDPFFEKMSSSYELVDGRPTRYGMGVLGKQYNGRATIEHSGGWNSYLTQYRFFPQENIGVLVASNNDFCNPFSIGDKVCDLLFPVTDHKGAKAGIFEPLPEDDWEGIYLSFNNRVRSVSRRGDSLLIYATESKSKPASVLRYDPMRSNDTCAAFVEEATGFPVLFAFGPGGRLRGFWWEGGDYFQCKRFYEKLEAGRSGEQKLSGKYRSAAFAQTLRIRRNLLKGGYKLKPLPFLAYPLNKIAQNTYQIKGGREVFRFDGRSLVFGSEWVFNVQFSKIK